MTDTATATEPKSRATATVGIDKSFILDGDTDIAQQYFELYKHRLQQLRPALQRSVASKWGSSVKLCEGVLDCQKPTHQQHEVAIIGTCFKDQKKKENVLDQYQDKAAPRVVNDDAKGNTVSSYIGKFISNTDFLLLEDEYGSVKLGGECVKKHRMLTGVVLAVKGKVNRASGVFMATDILLCGLPPCATPTQSLPALSKPKYVALVSGLEMSNLDPKYSMSLEMLFSYLNGDLDDDSSVDICRVIFAGNLIKEELPDEDQNIFYDKLFKKHEQAKISSLDSRLKELDTWISQLALSVAVDVMPGVQDPSDELLPQQPFHRCLFPLSSALNAFSRVTNPYAVTLDERLFVGTSGQNFHDMMKHSQLNMIECMELSINSRIIAPTAPDTLSCFPFKNRDPFLMKQCPHVYFSGNNDEFRHKTLQTNENGSQDVCLVQVPSFVRTKQIVLLNMETMKPQMVQIGIVASDS